MASDIDDLSVLDRRRIEAAVLGPMIRAFQEELSVDRAMAIAGRVMEKIAKEQGRAFRERCGSGDLKTFAANKGAWQAGNALETKVLVSTQDRYDFDVTRCRYAEMYEELGYGDLGVIFSCGRDSSFAQGFNPDITFTRTQTIMEGAPFCDFRYCLRDRQDAGDAAESHQS